MLCRLMREVLRRCAAGGTRLWLGLLLITVAGCGYPGTRAEAGRESRAAVAPALSPQRTHQNPVIATNLADPAVIEHEGVYYLYATGDVGDYEGYRVYTSSNLVDWARGSEVFRPGTSNVWAPDIWRDPDSGRFYLYYTADFTIGVAESDNPRGPFTARKKLVDHAIDAHVFRDDDGALYLYFVQFPAFQIKGQRLASPTKTVGEPTLLLQPEAEWERRAGHVTEGPWIIKRGGRYYLLYSGSGADMPDYATGYATADHPLGPFTRAPHNPIAHRSGGVFGPGHGCAVQDVEGRWWHVYHQKQSDTIDYDRFIAVDALWFDQYGNLFSRATRGSSRPTPAPLGPARVRQFDPFIWRSEPPPDCPFERSTELVGVEFLGRHSDYHLADTWYPSWAADGHLYSPFTDGAVEGDLSISDAHWQDQGKENVRTGQAVMIGDDPLNLTIRSLGMAKASPGAEYAGRYPCGSLVHNGIWYYGTYCLGPRGATPHEGVTYNWPVLGPMPGFRVSRDLGKTWQPSPHTPEKPLFPEPAQPHGPVKIGAPHFVDFGRNMEHSPDGKAYLVAHGTTRTSPPARFGHNSWITGDQVYLLRIQPSPDTINRLGAYEFFAGNDAQGRPRWTRDFSRIAPLLEWKDNMGCVTVTYFAPLKKYLMCVTDGGNTCSRMNTYLLESDKLTCPWRLVTYLKNFGEQAYFVNFPSKFISADGRTAWLCYSGNFATDWNNQQIRFNPPGTRYGLVFQQVRLLSPGEP
jgi:GH43 family beta-xylosidase